MSPPATDVSEAGRRERPMDSDGQDGRRVAKCLAHKASIQNGGQPCTPWNVAFKWWTVGFIDEARLPLVPTDPWDRTPLSHHSTAGTGRAQSEYVWWKLPYTAHTSKPLFCWMRGCSKNHHQKKYQFPHIQATFLQQPAHLLSLGNNCESNHKARWLSCTLVYFDSFVMCQGQPHENPGQTCSCRRALLGMTSAGITSMGGRVWRSGTAEHPQNPAQPCRGLGLRKQPSWPCSSHNCLAGQSCREHSMSAFLLETKLSNERQLCDIIIESSVWKSCKPVYPEFGKPLSLPLY